MRHSSHSPLQWFLYYDSKSDGDGEKAKSSIKHLIGALFITAITCTSRLSHNPVSKSQGQSSALLLFTCQGLKVLHKWKGRWMPCWRVYKPEFNGQKKELVKREMHLKSARFRQIAMPGAGRTCLYQEVSEQAECISAVFSGGAGNWASVAVGKAGEWLHSTGEILSGRDGWKSPVHAAAQSRTTARTRWGQLRLCLIMCGHASGAGVSWALEIACPSLH